MTPTPSQLVLIIGLMLHCASQFEVRQALKIPLRSGEKMLPTGLSGADCGVPMSVSQTLILCKEAGMDGIYDCNGSHGIHDF